MKFLKYIALALLTLVVTGTEAKTVKVPHVYLFGFSASFQDSLVFFTDIQDIPNAWYDKKTKFLAGRDTYSDQLKTFLTEQGAPNRVCMVFFSTNKSKLEKRYLKLRKKYMATPKKKKKSKRKKAAGGKGTVPFSYDIRYIAGQDFQFTPFDME